MDPMSAVVMAASSPSLDDIIEQQHAARFAKEGFPTPEQLQKEFDVQKTGAYNTYYGYVMRQANKNSLPNFDYRTWWQKQGTSGQDSVGYGDEPSEPPQPGYRWELVDTYNGKHWMQVWIGKGGGFGPVPGPKRRYGDDWDYDRDRNYWPDSLQKRRRHVRRSKRYLPYRRTVLKRSW